MGGRYNSACDVICSDLLIEVKCVVLLPGSSSSVFLLQLQCSLRVIQQHWCWSSLYVAMGSRVNVNREKVRSGAPHCQLSGTVDVVDVYIF